MSQKLLELEREYAGESSAISPSSNSSKSLFPPDTVFREGVVVVVVLR